MGAPSSVTLQQIQREEKVNVLVAAGSPIKADTKPEEVISSHPEQVTKHYTAEENLRSTLHNKCHTMETPIAVMSSRSHPEKVTVS